MVVRSTQGELDSAGLGADWVGPWRDNAEALGYTVE